MTNEELEDIKTGVDHRYDIHGAPEVDLMLADITDLVDEVEALRRLGNAMCDEVTTYWRGDGPKGSFDSVRTWRAEVQS